MSQRVNFKGNSNNPKVNKKIILFIVAVIVIIIIGILIKKYIDFYKLRNPNNKVVELQYDIDEYNSLEELLYAYDVELIRLDDSGNIDKIYVAFSRDLYTLDKSNKNHFEGIIRVVAEYRKFKNFELIDMTRDIEIKVSCIDTSIVQIVINGDENYFLNNDSKINANKIETPITPFSIQSKELQAFIDNKWNDSKINLGTRESICDGYDIYFDEGIKYKKVSGEVFNLIFTSKYEEPVAGGLYVTSTPEEVRVSLGNPTFSNSDFLYGYVSEDNYLFFDFMNQEISVYPVKEISKEDEEKLKDLINEMNESEDLKTFASDLMDMWMDYDEYNYNESLLDLNYTLRGLSLKFSMANLGDDGIFIYQNYSGNKDIQDLDNVYVSDKDSVFELEKNRVTQMILNIEEMSYESEEELRARGVEFSIRFREDLMSGENGYKGPMFFSRDRSHPDSELDRTLVISSYKWYDDYRIIYSIDNDGIYIYDCKTFQNVLIKEIDEKIIINEVKKNEIIYNNTISLKVDIK